VSDRVFEFNSAMPEWFEVLLLGLLEGITEFLPISSTGHMLLLDHWLKHAQPDVFFAVIQTGAVLAVLLVFTGRVKEMLTDWKNPVTRDFALKLFTAFVLTAIGGLILKKLHFKLPKDPMPIALATLIGGILIIWIEYAVRGKPLRDSVTWPVAIAIGVGQLLAVIFPGLSRSGSTIMIGIALGIARRPATEFSFLLGIPTLLSAAAVETLGALRHPEPGLAPNWAMIGFGTLVAAITAFIVVKWLLRFIQSHTFVGFGWYRIALGILTLALIKWL
jgi:undecaprenyl-diphosphatase